MDEVETNTLPIFNLQIPTAVKGVNAEILDPRKTYQEEQMWNTKANKLGALFVDNFVKFTDTEDGNALVAAGPQL